MFSPNSFYDYLRYYFNTTKKKSIIRTFRCPGDNNLYNNTGVVGNRMVPYLLPLTPADHVRLSTEQLTPIYDGFCEMFDQDPIAITSLIQESSSNISLWGMHHSAKPTPTQEQTLAMTSKIINNITDPIDILTYHSAGIHVPIVCHSEENSNDVNSLVNNNYIPVHYWYHALIGLFWFMEYKYLHPKTHTNPYRFGLYVRDASGTRSYRISLINALSSINHAVSFSLNEPLISQIKETNNDTILSKWDTNTNVVTSTDSAVINWPDTSQFDIHIVPETLFDTEKTHLTEKSLKPIVMGQPFIIVGCPNSLKYLQSYGFKTFNHLWDESYDNELSSDARLKRINLVIHNIANLSPPEYEKIVAEAKQIALFNRSYFYSEQFERLLMNELHSELDIAFTARKEMYYAMPGGTYYKIMDKFHCDKILPDSAYSRIKEMTQHMLTNDPIIATQIIKKYNHLL